MSFELHYSLSADDAKQWGVDPSSDILGIGPFRTRKQAESVAQKIKAHPESFGYYEWLKDAAIWVQREDSVR